MKTIKIPYTTSDQDYLVIAKYRKQQSNVVRYAYNRLTENKSEKEIRFLCKNLNNIDILNVWLIQIEDNSIVFKPNRNTKIKLQLPKLRKNYKNELFQLQQLAEQKAITISVQIDNNFIYLTFEEKLLESDSKSHLK